MIQRIQSLWMLCSAIIAGTVSFFCPLARLTVTEDFSQDLTGWSFLPLGVILMLVALITLFDIFLFRKRALQMRLMTFSIVLLVGWYLLYAYAYWQLWQEAASRLDCRFARWCSTIRLSATFSRTRCWSGASTVCVNGFSDFLF